MAAGGSERPRAPTALVGLGLGLALLASMGASCRTRPEDCEHASIERCKWEQAVNDSAGPDRADEGAEDPSQTDDEGVEGGGVTMTETEQDELDGTLDEMIEIMAAGLEWSLTDERARSLCRQLDDSGELVPARVTIVTAEDDDQPPRPSDDPSPDEAQAPESDDVPGPDDEVQPTKPRKAKRPRKAKPGAPEVWRCALDWLRINEAPLVLEASAGVVALSAQGLTSMSSESIAAFAQARFDDWCASPFEEIEDAGLDDIRRCDLPAGPYLVIARFPSDEEAMTWQVSIAVVDAG